MKNLKAGPSKSTILRWCLLFVVSLASTVAIAQRPADQQAATPEYTHLLYQRMRKTNGVLKSELALHRLPKDSKDLAESIDPTKTVCPSQGMFSAVPVVHRGRIYVPGMMGRIAAVNISDGKSEQLATMTDLMLRLPASDSLLTTTAGFTSIQLINLSTKNRRTIIKGSMKRPSIIGNASSRISVSPDGKSAVSATYVEEGSNFLTHCFEIHLIDLTENPPTVRRAKETYPGTHVMTGGGDHAYAPAMIWKDDESILLAAGKKGINQDNEFVVTNKEGAVIQDNRSKLQLLLLNATTLKSTHICELPLATSSMMTTYDPEFWRRSDGEIILRAQKTSDLRVDLGQLKVIPDRRLSADYELRGDEYIPSLYYKNDVLAERVSHRDVSISPDGKSIVWLTPNRDWVNAFNNTSEPKTLWLHSEKTGMLPLLSGRFGGIHRVPDNPTDYPKIRWLTDADLKRTP